VDRFRVSHGLDLRSRCVARVKNVGEADRAVEMQGSAEGRDSSGGRQLKFRANTLGTISSSQGHHSIYCVMCLSFIAWSDLPS
jgi:hypothetical protein